MRSGIALALMVLALPFISSGQAAAAPPANAAQGPAVTNAVYRVTVGPRSAGTGIAVSADGWVITTADIVGRCPAPPASCDLGVEDPALHLSRRAETVAVDPATGLALLRTDAALPAAATLEFLTARRGGPARAFGNDLPIPTDNDRPQRTFKQFGDPPASGTVLVSTLECRSGTYGSGMFDLDDGHLVGIIVGAHDGAADRGVTAVVPTSAVRAFYETSRAAYEGRSRPARNRR